MKKEEIKLFLQGEYIRNHKCSIDCLWLAVWLSLLALVSQIEKTYTNEITMVFAIMSLLSNLGYWLFKNEAKKIFNILANDEAVESFTKFTNEEMNK